MKREITREYEESGSSAIFSNKLKIGVTGIGHSAGCSFIATSLAWILSRNRKKSIAFVQGDLSGRSDIYDALCMDKRFSFRSFYDFFDAVDRGENVRGKSNKDEGINWAIISPETESRPDMRTILTLVNNISCDITVCDLGNIYDYPIKYKKHNVENYLKKSRTMDKEEYSRTEDSIYCGYENAMASRGEYRDKLHCSQISEEINRLVNDMDCVIAVIDPMPSKLVGNSKVITQLKFMETKGHKVIYVVNKYNSGVKKGDFHRFMKIRDIHYLPLISEENFYIAQYNCKIPITYDPIKKGTQEILNKIAELAMEV